MTEEEDIAFYEKHYSDWEVHTFDLRVRVPTATGYSTEDALELVRDTLDAVGLDIRASPIEEKPKKDEKSIWDDGPITVSCRQETCHATVGEHCKIAVGLAGSPKRCHSVRWADWRLAKEGLPIY